MPFDDFDKTIDSQYLIVDVLLNLLQQEIPGILYKIHPNGYGFVQPGINLTYPNGRACEDFYAPPGKLKGLFDVDQKVVVRLEAASGEEKNKKNNSDLKQVATIKEISDEDFHKMVSQLNLLGSVIQRFEEQIEKYTQKCCGLDAHIETEIQRKYEVLKMDLNKKEEEITQREQKAKQEFENVLKRNVEVEEQKVELEQNKAEFDKKQGTRILKILEECEDQNNEQEKPSFLSAEISETDPTIAMREALANSGYQAQEEIIRQVALSACVAAATGQFVVLTGPPGSGKTSLTQKLSSQFSAGYACVPVRPAWIDPTDLLGFYNPSMKRYQPAPFLDKVLEASKYSEANRLYFLVLDEMNLGRIENYAADLMAQMEKTKEKEQKNTAQVSLYSDELYKELVWESNAWVRHPESFPNPEDARDQIALRKHLDKYPASLPIPDGLVLFGTINMDETTHSLSPKFLDRAFVIQIAETSLSDSFGAVSNGETQKDVFSLPLDFLRRLAETEIRADQINDIEDIWKDVVVWNTKYFAFLGLRLSQRTANVFRTYLKVASALNMTDMREVTSLFVMSKILPGISFHEDAKAGAGTNTKREILDEWTKELGKYTQLKEAVKQIIEQPGPMHRYLR